jgi:uncharacterized Zn finger protein
MGWSRYDRFPPYVSVAERKKQAQAKIASLRKKGKDVQPVVIEGRNIAKTFWSKAWCENLESYSDFENRLPRGRTYARNGSVIDLQISSGEINALVAGSQIYNIKITIHAINQEKWQKLVTECSGKIDSLIELLQGKMSKGLMQVITHKDHGLFPAPKEIQFNCSCPDWADMCKHTAAVLYGVGARINDRPEDLFLLRKVEYADLVAQASVLPIDLGSNDAVDMQIIQDDDLSALFGIDIEQSSATHVSKKTRSKSATATNQNSEVLEKLQKKKAASVKTKATTSKTVKAKAKPQKKKAVSAKTKTTTSKPVKAKTKAKTQKKKAASVKTKTTAKTIEKAKPLAKKKN